LSSFSFQAGPQLKTPLGEFTPVAFYDQILLSRAKVGSGSSGDVPRIPGATP
jgi:hypothetical protein